MSHCRFISQVIVLGQNIRVSLFLWIVFMALGTIGLVSILKWKPRILPMSQVCLVSYGRWCCPHLFVGLLIMATTYCLCYQETAIRLKFELHICSRALTRI